MIEWKNNEIFTYLKVKNYYKLNKLASDLFTNFYTEKELKKFSTEIYSKDKFLIERFYKNKKIPESTIESLTKLSIKARNFYATSNVEKLGASDFVLNFKLKKSFENYGHTRVAQPEIKSYLKDVKKAILLPSIAKNPRFDHQLLYYTEFDADVGFKVGDEYFLPQEDYNCQCSCTKKL